jgi:PEP-CTERM motif
MGECLSLSLSRLAPVVAAALMVSAAGAARADVTVFTNSSGSPSFSDEMYFDVGGSGSGSPKNQVLGMPFTAGATADLADALLALSYQLGTNGPITLYLESNASGQPGTILATLTQVGSIPSAAGLVTFDYGGAPVALVSGTQYWLVAVQPDSSTTDRWYLSNADTGATAYNEVGNATGPWTLLSDESVSAFQVDGSAVPEPSTWAMMLLGFAGLGFVGWRGRRNVRVA